MSNPDWTEAHDDATHYDTLRDVFCNYNFWWHKNKQILMCKRDLGDKRYTPRPVGPIDTARDGTGLPPVGTECEAVWLDLPDGGSRDFECVIIKGYYKKQVWFCTTSGENITHLIANVDFRPLRTQTEREELIRIATQVLNHDDVLTERHAAEALFDAGMLRKAGK